MLAWLVSSLLVFQAPGGAIPDVPPPQQPPAPAPVDPATASFTTAVGLLLVPVKPDKAPDYEAAIAALQAALSVATDPARRPLAQGWRVFKASEPDAKGNVLYVHALLPTVPGADYRPSLLIDELLQDAPAEMLAKYKEALAGAPMRLSLTELANMGVAPVKK
ncbi:MAG: hypothetical protein AB7Q16_07175 [Vicinamibacterales bacterium]